MKHKQPCDCDICFHQKKILKRYTKIGRYYYEKIPSDERGEPKLLERDEVENIFTLVDYDGEPIITLRRILDKKKFKSWRKKQNTTYILKEELKKKR